MSSVRLDFEGLDAQLLSNARELLFRWLPNGKILGHEFCVGDIAGSAGESLKFNLRTGVFKDFADESVAGRGMTAFYAVINRVTNGDAYRALGGAAPSKPVTSAPTAEAVSIEYAKQSDFEGKEFIHYQHGTAKVVTPYHIEVNGEWKIAAVVARFESENGKKTFLPYIWTRHGWKSTMPATPRPLYGHKRLKEFTAKPVLIVEGEKCAAIAEELFPSTPVVTWMGGAPNILSNDWSVLKGRHVVLWPDADSPGWKAMKRLGAHLMIVGVEKLQWIETVHQTDGWDIADAKEEMKTAQAINAWMAQHIGEFTEDLNTPEPPKLQVIEGGKAKRGKPADNDGVFHVEHIQARWTRWGLQANSRGPYANESNVSKCLQAINNENISPLPWYDRFKNRLLWQRTPDSDPEQWTDVQNQELLIMLQGQIGLQNVRIGHVERTISQWAYQHSRDCWQEHLLGLQWDGKTRLEQLFTTGMGATDNEYTRAVGRCFVMGMVARGLSPGCQLDYAIVLEGPQGNLKSSACRALGSPHFAEVHTAIGTERWQEVIQGLALAEFAEMQSWSSSRNETIKAAITNRTDKYRAAYRRDSEEHPRRVAFIATTNLAKWVTDDTGARRFWPIKTTHIDLGWIKTHREQLLAEAVVRYQRKEEYHLNPVEEQQAKQEQRARQISDPWDMAIEYYLSSRGEANIAAICEYALRVELGKISWQEQRRIDGTLRRFGWVDGERGTYVPGDELKDYREENPGASRLK